jgi:hypothetical protein
MPQDPDTLIPDLGKFQAEREKQRADALAKVREAHRHAQQATSRSHTGNPHRLEGDELVAWIRSGIRIEQAVEQHEAVGLAALRARGLKIGEWQIDPDGYLLPQPS